MDNPTCFETLHEQIAQQHKKADLLSLGWDISAPFWVLRSGLLCYFLFIPTQHPSQFQIFPPAKDCDFIVHTGDNELSLDLIPVQSAVTHTQPIKRDVLRPRSGWHSNTEHLESQLCHRLSHFPLAGILRSHLHFCKLNIITVDLNLLGLSNLYSFR